MMDRLRSFGLALGVACAAAGCGANISRPAPAPDCATGDGYDFPAGIAMSDATLAAGTLPNGYAFDDLTPRGLLNGLPHMPSPPAGRTMAVDPALTCGHAYVLDLQSSGHNDYGSTFVLEWKDFQNSLDASGTTGVAFWARSAKAESDKSVFVELSDRYTDARGLICIDTGSSMMTGTATTNPTQMPGTGMGSGASPSLPLAVPGPHDCSNFYQRVLQFTDEWSLYLLPFDSFAQSALPNRNPNGLDTSELWSISFQIPKEADFEVWIDQIAVYQPSPAAAGP